ncbi:MAG: PAS domain S-box protein [Acidobacteriaceae bacterium]|nr:PAS domain S-box protein [Acidobacteriaceae bacterium]
MSQGATQTELDFLRRRVAELETECARRSGPIALTGTDLFMEGFQGLAQALPVLVWTARPDGYSDFSNERWLRYTGQTPAEAYGLGWLAAVHPEDYQRIHDAWWKAVEQKEAYEIDYRIRRASDGQWRWHLVRAFPVKNAEGEILKWIGASTDIHDRYEAEQKLQELSETLRRSEARFRRLVEGSLFGIAIGDFHGNLLYANNAFLSIIGYTREEFEREGLRWTDLTPPEWLERDWKAAQELRERGYSAPFEKEYLRKDGSRVPILVARLLLDEPFGEQEEMVAFVTDLGDMKKAQRALERSNEELQRFAYTASHDLQEPIRTVIIFTQMLARQHTGKLSKEADTQITFILEAANRMSKLVASLLEYSRVSEEPDTLRAPVDLNRALDQVLQMLSFSIADSKAEISYDALPVVLGDEQQLLRLLQNLISNAIKYRRPEKPPQICISVEPHDGHEWLFSVTDQGIGFRPEYAETIFGMFKRIHGKKYSGTGIGLAICRKIVERHGGSLWAVSRGESEGSTFFFTLPRQHAT